MKRFLSIVFTFVMILSLSACGSPKAPENPFNISLIGGDIDGSFHGNNFGVAPNTTYEIFGFLPETDEAMENAEFFSSNENVVKIDGNTLTSGSTKNVAAEITAVYDGKTYDGVYITIT